MNENIIEIQIGMSLADAELASYFYSILEKKLIIIVKAWNEKLIEFSFSDLLLFVDRGSHSITAFCRNTTESDLFKQAIVKFYEVIPQDHPYKMFQFLDLDDQPDLEIICDHFDVKIH